MPNVRNRILRSAVVSLLALTGAVTSVSPAQATTSSCFRTSSVVVIKLSATKHEHIIAHANAAVKEGAPSTLVLHRAGAASRRSAAVSAYPIRKGYDRDEYPPAVGRKVNKASVWYVNSSENRSAGAIMGNTLRRYCDGTRFRYAGVTAKSAPSTKPPTNVYYANCAAVRAAGKAPIRKGQPGYSSKLDRDGDGVACE